MVRKQKGFTITELIIVMVTIAILAAIILSLYLGGIKHRSQVSVARIELRAVAEATELFRIEYERAPLNAADFAKILKEAGVYNSTRTTTKSYAICADQNGYSFIAWNPVIKTYKNGGALYLYSSKGGQQLHELTNSSLSSNNQLSKICDQVQNTSTFEAWTYNL